MKPTLVVFIRALIGQKLEFVLRNETKITGTLEEVDDNMKYCTWDLLERVCLGFTDMPPLQLDCHQRVFCWVSGIFVRV
jgi:hypothetical protein